MAIHLPNNLYSEGQVPLNSNAFTQFYLNSQMRKRAKEDALNTYYQNLGRNINSAGMRSQDIENGWSQKVNDWRNYYTQNRQAIQNPLQDNGVAQNEYYGRLQDILNDTEKSKQLAANTAKLLPILADPNKRTRLPDAFLDNIHAQDLPMYNSNHKPLDITTLDYDAKPFDAAMQSKYLAGVQKGLTMGDLLTGTKIDAKSHQLVNTFKSTYSPDTLDALYKRAASSYKSDPSFRDYVDNELSSPIAHQQLNDKFKAVYGKDITTPEDVAAAWTLNSIQTEKEKQKTAGYNQYQGMSIWGANQKPNPAELWSQSLVQAGNIAAQTGDATQLRNVASQLFSGNGSRRLGNKQEDVRYEVVNGRPAIKLTTYPITDAERDKEYSIKEEAVKNKKLPASVLNQDGLVSTFYLDEGTPQLLSKLGGLWQQTMSSDTKAETPQYYNMGKTQVPSVSKQKTTIKSYNVGGKKYTHDDLKKLGYTDEQIAEAIKLGTIKE